MPKERAFRNAFTKRELARISGLSVAMIDYLVVHDFMRATYRDDTGDARGSTSGRVRYFSYRDLVVARILQNLRAAGVTLSKLKKAIRFLDDDMSWTPATGSHGVERLRWLVFDGKEVLLRSDDGFLDELVAGSQRSFAFVVDIQGTVREIVETIPQDRREAFSMVNQALLKDCGP